MRIETVKASRGKERKERLANGTWMLRGAVISTGKQKAMSRNNLKKELRKELAYL